MLFFHSRPITLERSLDMGLETRIMPSLPIDLPWMSIAPLERGLIGGGKGGKNQGMAPKNSSIPFLPWPPTCHGDVAPHGMDEVEPSGILHGLGDSLTHYKLD